MKTSKDLVDNIKPLVHQHVLIRAFVSNPPMEEEYTKNWLRELVTAINMKICLEPQAKFVDIVGNKGITALVGIETSHISCHVWSEPDPAVLQMDVYSCAHFEPETVIKHLGQFGLLKYEMLHVNRETRKDNLNEDQPIFAILEHCVKKL